MFKKYNKVKDAYMHVLRSVNMHDHVKIVQVIYQY